MMKITQTPPRQPPAPLAPSVPRTTIVPDRLVDEFSGKSTRKSDGATASYYELPIDFTGEGNLDAILDQISDARVARIFKVFINADDTAERRRLRVHATQLYQLLNIYDVSSNIGEVLRAAYRFGKAEHSNELRDAKKILFYLQAEAERLLMYPRRVVVSYDSALIEAIALIREVIRDKREEY